MINFCKTVQRNKGSVGDFHGDFVFGDPNAIFCLSVVIFQFTQIQRNQFACHVSETKVG